MIVKGQELNIQTDQIACDGCKAILVYVDATYSHDRLLQAQVLPIFYEDFEGNKAALHLCSPCLKYVPENVVSAFVGLVYSLKAQHMSQVEANCLALEAQQATINKIKDAVNWHKSQQRDNRCWLDDLQLYKTVLGDEAKSYFPDLLPRQEFLANCAHFFDCQKAGLPYAATDELASAQILIAQLRAENAELKRKQDEGFQAHKKALVLEQQLGRQYENLKLELGKMRAEEASCRFKEPVFVILLQDAEDLIRRFVAGPPNDQAEIDAITDRINKWLKASQKAREESLTYKTMQTNQALKDAFDPNSKAKKPQ